MTKEIFKIAQELSEKLEEAKELLPVIQAFAKGKRIVISAGFDNYDDVIKECKQILRREY